MLYFVTLTGAMDLGAAKEMLRVLWKDAAYQNSIAVIYDIGGLDALPDLNDMLVLSHYVVTHKRQRGPSIIAFVAPEFASAGMKKVFAGFAKVVGLSLNFCGSQSQARTLITSTKEIK